MVVLALLLFAALHSSLLSHAESESPVPVNVGLILDLETKLGKMSDVCISLAIEDFNSIYNHNKKLVIHRRHSGRDVVQVASNAIELLNNVGVEAIIGPQRSEEVALIAELGDKAKVPIISFTATSPSLSSTKSPYFVRTAQDDSFQVGAIVELIQTCGWREIRPIFEDSEFGMGLIPFLTDELQQIGVSVPYTTPIPPSSTNGFIEEELKNLASNQTRVFVVHLPISLGVRFFKLVYEQGMMSKDYVWIITNSIGNKLDSINASVLDSMRGVLGVKSYVPRSSKLGEFAERWRHRFRLDYPGIKPLPELNVFGLWAYDTIQALGLAVEKVTGVGTYKFLKTNRSWNWEDPPIRPSGMKLLEELRETKLARGLSGEFRVVNGQLQSKLLQIVNVLDRGVNETGFWRPDSGLSLRSPKVQAMHNNMKFPNRSSTHSLQSIITWPGEDSTEVPRGWAVPGGKILKIGVPNQKAYPEFADVQKDQDNVTVFKGYCVELFKAVVDVLNYTLPYNFEPFEETDGSYDDLVYRVYLKRLDAVVGDTTILAERSNYVDFTLPYTESGVSMIVPIQAEQKNALVFLKPLTWQLWLITLAFFIFTGLVVWALERGMGQDTEFKGSVSEQMGMIFYFIFSTLVFKQRERPASNLCRVVVIIWVFVVFIFQSSYTASLSSMLTVQRLQPSVTDLETLLKDGDTIGYRNGTFVVRLLKWLNVPDSKIKALSNRDEIADALTKGSRGGGVSAFFDEIPYNNIFLNQYCDKYTMVGPIYKNAGLGFVFPRGSPLVSDISRAILYVTEGPKMAQMEEKWFGNHSACLDSKTTAGSTSLHLSSFWSLFVITGAVSIGALVIRSFSLLMRRQNENQTGERTGEDRLLRQIPMSVDQPAPYEDACSSEQGDSRHCRSLTMKTTLNKRSSYKKFFSFCSL